MSKKSYSKASPIGGKRGCLCKNGKYSKKCCNGETLQQGIGTLTGQGSEVTISNTTTRTTSRVSTDTQL